MSFQKFGELSFDVKSIKCPQCGFDFKNSTYPYELYFDMVQQSKIQGEPQLDNYVDYFKKIEICVNCLKPFIIRAKFIKIHNYVRLETQNYRLEKDAVWIAQHAK